MLLVIGENGVDIEAVSRSLSNDGGDDDVCMPVAMAVDDDDNIDW